ncbi:MAG: patatin-like phospholipase family protein [Saprospiraceae bacterium]
MKALYCVLVAITLVLSSSDVVAQAAPPRIGFALSGGGAKGLAHIGVLKVLEANGIVPDYVTGTSMGSIVGGLYAIGYTPNEIEKLALGLDWNSYFSDAWPRNLQPIEQRAKSDRYQLSFAWEDGHLRIPKGLLGGKKILTLLTRSTASVHGIHSFSEYYIPFKCVATDLETGAAYIFDKPPLRKAIRASMSIPSAFEPVEYDGRLLVDGLLARNLPVQDVIAMGADFTLGVDVGDPLYPRDQLTSVLKVLEQTSSYGMSSSTKVQRSLADFIIDPDLSAFTTLSYDATAAIIQQGEKAAQEALPQLQLQLEEMGWHPTPARPRPRLRRDSFLINEIKFKASESTTQRTLRQLSQFKHPNTYTLDEIDVQINRLYASGFFSLVDYELTPLLDTDGYTLTLEAASNPSVYLRGSVSYDIDFNAALLLNLSVRNQLGYGSLLSTDIRVSEYPGFWIDYSITTRSTPGLGIRLFANGQFIPGLRFSDGELLDEFSFHQYSAGAALQVSLSRQWYFRTGFGGEHFSENPRFFSLSEVDARAQRWLGFVHLIRDTYDRTYFPKDGSFSEAWIEYNLGGKIEEVGKSPLQTSGVITVGGKMHKAFSVASNWWIDTYVGLGHNDYRDDHLLQRFYLGREVPESRRFFEVYGYRLSELNVSTFAFLRLQLRRQIGSANYIGVGYNPGYYAQVVNREVLEEGFFDGIGMELGRITPLGPLRLTIEYNTAYQRFNYSFFAGYRF